MKKENKYKSLMVSKETHKVIAVEAKKGEMTIDELVMHMWKKWKYDLLQLTKK